MTQSMPGTDLPTPSNAGPSTSTPQQSPTLLDGLIRYTEAAKNKTGVVGEVMAPCPATQPDVQTPMEQLLKTLIANVYGSPDKMPRLWTCYSYASPDDKKKYLDRIQQLFQKNASEAATQLAIANMSREEYQKTTYQERKELIDKTWPEAASKAGGKRQQERANAERKGFERAVANRLKDPATRAEDFEASLRDQSFPSIQYDLGSGGDGPTAVPDGWVRCYVTVGNPHKNPSDSFKDVWRDGATGKITATAGGAGEHFWVSVGMPRRQVFYFYKYFLDGAPAPTIRSFLIPKSVFQKDIASGAISEEEKKERTDALVKEKGIKPKDAKVEYTALTTDSARSPNQFGVGPEATAKMLAAADPKSLVTIGMPSARDSMDPFQDGAFYTIEEFKEAVGVPQDALTLPDGGTPSYSESKGTVKSRDAASEQSELARLLASMEAVERVLHGDSPTDALPEKPEDAVAQSAWMLRLVEVNNLAPCAVMRSGVRDNAPVPHDAHGNPEDRAHEETLFAYFIMTHPKYWREGVEAVNKALMAEDDARAALDLDRDKALKANLSSHVPNLGNKAQWQPILQDAQDRIGDGQDPDQMIQDLSLMFYLYRPLMRKLAKTDKLDVTVNTRQFNAQRAIASATAQERKPFGLLPRDGAPDDVRPFPPDMHRSLDRYVPEAEHLRKPGDKLASTQESLQMPFAGGISGTTRDFTERLVPPDAPKTRNGLRVKEEEYWQFQTANAAFMVGHGYHSFYESMSVAFSHPDFGKGKQPVGAAGGKNVYSDTMGQVNKDIWQDYQKWKAAEVGKRGGGTAS
jgi:hypothetical protein